MLTQCVLQHENPFPSFPQNDTEAMTVFLKHLSRSFTQYNIAVILDSAG